MFRTYANTEQICNALSWYKVGEKVTLLYDKKVSNGMYTAGSVLCIKNIKINPDINCPDIYLDELVDYTASRDAFVYILAEESAAAQTVECSYYQIAPGEINADYLEQARQQRKEKIDFTTLVAFLITLIIGIGILIWASILIFTLEKILPVIPFILVPLFILLAIAIFLQDATAPRIEKKQRR